MTRPRPAHDLRQRLAAVPLLVRLRMAPAVVVCAASATLLGRWAGAADAAPLASLPLGLVLPLIVVMVAGLQVFGMAMNDLLDMRRDRVLAPHRPLVNRRMPATWAMLIATVAVLAAVGASLPLGLMSTVMCLAAAGLIVFYNALAKHVPAIGIVTLGIIASVIVLAMPEARRAGWVVWLVMTHVIGVAAAAYVYQRKRPQLRGVHLWGVIAGWAFWSMVLITWLIQRDRHADVGSHWVWVGPALAAAGFAVVAAPMMLWIGDRREAGHRLIGLGVFWLGVYGVAWLVGAGLWIEAGIMAASLVVGQLAAEALHRMAGPPHIDSHLIQRGERLWRRLAG